MKLVLLICFICIFQQQVLSQSDYLVRSTIGRSGTSGVSENGGETFVIQESVGQSSVIGTYINNNYILRQGFIQPNVLAKITDKNIPLGLQLTVFPNPFDKQLSIAFKEKVSGKVDITVFDVSGRFITSKSYQENQLVDVKLNALPSGSYILKVIANTKQFVTKIIKK
ncbi:T9SS type A sorting domain-containing protein [Flavivirga spongiicola]|uniref:T9SS type A sorting domain-containing protein n=1 Tax=Flavivirga spongiicola TaxID=421621 RepID=A0ABU7XVC3_9FLAO|nr:T9SS type A sorting domain-containing protein [Flavivirga sp. MEBiC05379]MDO5979709.1 T9SS type A sorting domain-containing protein [Flavivirga sp. MEBiC05379]